MNKKLVLLSTESVKDKELYFSESNNSFDIKEISYQDENITEANGEEKKDLKVVIKAIHAGRTGNEHIFKADKIKGSEELKSGVVSFTKPYYKPMLTHHNTRSEPVGRIVNAYYSEEEGGMAVIEVIVSDPDAIEKVKDGRYNTVSIGAKTNSATCNICGTDVLKEYCSHRRGEEYDGVICGWELGDLWFYECSFVNVPADENATVLQWTEVDYEPYNKASESQEDTAIEEGTTMKVAASNEHMENNSDNNESNNDSENNEEANTSEENTDTEEETSANSNEAETEAGANTENTESNITNETVTENITAVNIANDVNISEESINNIKDIVKETVSELVLKTNKQAEEIQQSYQTILSSSKTIELAFTALKEFYNKLRTYSDQDSKEYDETWSLEEQVNEIRQLFEQIDSEIELGTNYEVEHGEGTSQEHVEEKPQVKESIENDVYGLMTKKKF